jgi:hypothetical protein
MTVIDWLKQKLLGADKTRSREIVYDLDRINLSKLLTGPSIIINGIDDYIMIYDKKGLELNHKLYTVKIFGDKANNNEPRYAIIFSEEERSWEERNLICAEIPKGYILNIDDDEKFMYTNVAAFISAAHDLSKIRHRFKIDIKIPEWDTPKTGLYVSYYNGFDSNVPISDRTGVKEVKFSFNNYSSNSGDIKCLTSMLSADDRFVLLRRDPNDMKTRSYISNLKIKYFSGAIYSFKYSSSVDATMQSNIIEVDAKAPVDGMLRITITMDNDKKYKMVILDSKRKIHYIYTDSYREKIKRIQYEFK